MNAAKLLALLAGALVAATAHAAGVLYTTDKPGDPQPLRWDTRAPIPVYTDLGVFTYDFDGVTPFITNARANQIVGFALDQWSKVPTSTLRARVAGNFMNVPSIATDINGSNAHKVYGVFNGGGMHVVYDTDGSILENFFGVPRDAVLGIAFPEWSEDRDGDGFAETITEATVLLNGWAVNVNDPQGHQFAGVATHEIGHALNLSHSQVNGQMAYFSYPGGADLYPGVPGCVAPKHHFLSGDWGGDPMPAALIETMFPFIDTNSHAGTEMSTVDLADDIAAISNLYPTASYRTGTGSISGVLRLKDGRTPFSGINIVARNVNNPLGDAVSAMTGDQTQGKAGPDGRFTINNLQLGQHYHIYTEEIVAGGYPTQPRALVSEAEYWNLAESANPISDPPCDATGIVAQANPAKSADLVFNGYKKGVQYTLIADAQLVDLSKNGNRASGIVGTTQFIWDAERGFEVLPPEMLATWGSMTRNGRTVLVNTDTNRNGVSSAALWSTSGKLVELGSLNGDRCGLDGNIGVASSTGLAVDDFGRTAVGLAHIDADGDGTCQSAELGEILPFIWTAKRGMRRLDTTGHDFQNDYWLRAHAVSGDGSVVLGMTNSNHAMAWVDEGKLIDLTKRFGGVNAYAASFDGSRVAFDTLDPEYRSLGVRLWNPKNPRPGLSPLIPIGSLRWCIDMPLLDFSGDQCAAYDPATVQRLFGLVPMQVNDMSDDGKVLIGRAGTFWNGFTGAMWVEGIGWFKLNDFFRAQGVVEAYRHGLDNPMSISAAGTEMIGGIVGAPVTWHVDMHQVFVCQNGRSMQVGFPEAAVQKVKAGAKMGRCEHL
jgi:Matrixin